MTDRIALEYRPADSERLPWAITVNGAPPSGPQTPATPQAPSPQPTV